MWGEFNPHISLVLYYDMNIFVSSYFKLCGCLLQGVMEAIRISCAGYPTRKNFDEFVQRFSIMEPKVLKSWYLLLLFSVFSFYDHTDECDCTEHN